MDFMNVGLDIPNLPLLPHQIFNHRLQQQPDNVLMLPQPDNLVMLPHQIFNVHRQQPNNLLVSSEDGATSLPAQSRNHQATSLPAQNRNHHRRIRVRRQRLDFDSIPYEQLLELQERIGNVNTGLSEENSTNCLKTRTVTFGDVKDEKIFNETCIVCQDKYKDNDMIGTLKCGHEYHRDCIKEWLVLKNVCPICKRPALSTAMPIN